MTISENGYRLATADFSGPFPNPFRRGRLVASRIGLCFEESKYNKIVPPVIVPLVIYENFRLIFFPRRLLERRPVFRASTPELS